MSNVWAALHCTVRSFAANSVKVLAAMCSRPALLVPERGGASELGVDGGDGCFLYLAYGSNLLAERLHLANPSAARVATAQARGWRLAFGHWSQRWGGAVATIVNASAEAPQQQPDAWGAVWAINEEHRATLDAQEGVAEGVYEPLEVEAQTAAGEVLLCRSYRLRSPPPPPPVPLPDHLLPSRIYWQVMVTGAEESSLPEEYVQWLRSLPHNNYTGGLQIGQLAEGLQTPLSPTPLPPSSPSEA